jgi:hypothetical protein
MSSRSGKKARPRKKKKPPRFPVFTHFSTYLTDTGLAAEGGGHLSFFIVEAQAEAANKHSKLWRRFIGRRPGRGLGRK